MQIFALKKINQIFMFTHLKIRYFNLLSPIESDLRILTT